LSISFWFLPTGELWLDSFVTLLPLSPQAGFGDTLDVLAASLVHIQCFWTHIWSRLQRLILSQWSVSAIILL
jgi:hypothetical protein